MTKTYWFEKNGMLCCRHYGDESRTNVTAREHEFPMSPSSVAVLMNKAFEYGMQAKATQIRNALGIRNER